MFDRKRVCDGNYYGIVKTFMIYTGKGMLNDY